uniref:Uncharacterized protein n=1 Tax=Graphocephala atropunctata TaxID=36148 RepID=A0A1B6L782_9HEMI
MSGDVQPRKRKDKRKKKGSLDVRRNEEYSEESAFFRRQSSAASEDEEVLQHHGSIGGSDEVIHVHKESNLGGNICSKIVFFGLLGALGVMVGLIIIEYHGTTDVDTQSASDSPWSVMLEGWVDNSVAGHDDHEPAEHEDEGHDEHDEHAFKPLKKSVAEEDDTESEELFEHAIKPQTEEEEDVINEDSSVLDEEIEDQEEDETTGGEVGLIQTAEELPESADVPPSYVMRRQTLLPTEVLEETPIITHSQAEAEYSEGEHEDEAAEEDIDEVSFVKQTYEDLKAAYSQVTPEESEAEQTEEASLKSNEEGATESEPEASETEEEDEEEEVKEDDPLGQWKSDSGPELLAEEVEEVQTGSETEEESEDEEEEAPTGGPNSNEIDDGQDSQNFVNEEILEPVEHLGEPVAKVDSYENADITNEADWEIREALDEADQDLEDGDYPA